MLSSTQKVNLNKAFAASFSISQKNEEKRAFSLTDRNSVFNKYASLTIDNPTEENISDYVRSYAIEELGSEIPKSISVSVDSLDFGDTSKTVAKKEKQNVNVTGIVTFHVGKKNIELPFTVQDNDLIPFNIIQMDGQRVPYSRENLRKIILGVLKGENENKNGAVNANTPYIGFQENRNPMTSNGFLADALSIRDTVSRNRNLGMMSTASFLDDMLEKLANIKPLGDSDFEKIAKYATIAMKQKEKSNKQEKLAAEKENENVSRDDDKKYIAEKSAPSIDANTLPNWTLINFYERYGNSITNKKGIVIKNIDKESVRMLFENKKKYNPDRDFTERRKADYNMVLSSINKIVLSEDNRVFVLSDGKKFPCTKCSPDDNHFAIHQTSISRAKKNTIFTILSDKNKQILPISRLGWTQTKEPLTDVGKDYTGYYDSFEKANTKPNNKEIVTIALSNSQLSSLFSDDVPGYIGERVRYKIKVKPFAADNIDSEYRVDKTKDDEFESTSESQIIVLENTPIVPIEGLITHVVNKDVIPAELLQSDKVAFMDNVNLEKIAMDQGYVRVTCRDRNAGAYDVLVRYVDKSKKFFKEMKKEFNYVSEAKLRFILRALKFNDSDMRAIIIKSRNENYAQSAISENVKSEDYEKLNGGVTTNISKKSIKDSFGKIIKPETLVRRAALVAGTALTANAVKNFIKNSGPDSKLSGVLLGNKKSVYNDLKSAIKETTAETEELSIYFEKMAYETKNDEVLCMAKTATVCHNFNDMFNKVIDGEIYLDTVSIAKNIVKNKDELSKIASEVIDFNREQISSRNEIIPREKLASLVANIDITYKTAKSVIDALK